MGATLYDTPEAVIAASGHSYYLRFFVGNGIVKKSYIGFVYNGQEYYVQGGVDESSLTSQPVFESNKELLENLVGASQCSAWNYGNSYYMCSFSGFFIAVAPNGAVMGSDGAPECHVYSDGTTLCGIWD